MATTVSCQQSVCKNVTDSLEANSTISDAEIWIVKVGCTDLNFNETQCQTTDNLIYTCNCAATFTNNSAWESLVAQAGGRSCATKFTYEFVGAITNTTQVVRFTATVDNIEPVAIGATCNDTDIQAILTPGLNTAVDQLNQIVAKIQKANVTFTTGTITATACGASTQASRTFGGATTAPTTAAPTTSAPTQPGNTTQAPTAPPKNGAASIIASSFVLVASMIAANIMA